MIDCQRAQFSLPADAHYLNCAYMGPLSRRTQDAGTAAVLRKADPTRIAVGDFFEESDRARALFAALIGAPAERIALVPAVSYALAIVERNLAGRHGGNVVIAAEQFPSNVYAWRRLCRRTGAQLRTVAPPVSADARGAAWNQALLDAIDRDTLLVALPHVHWTDGTRFDLERLAERARQVGAAFVVDGTQSIGALPFDVGRVQPDFVACAAYKWLLGPYSIGFAFVGDRFADGEPLEETWIGRAGSRDFRALVDYRDDYQPGALRFDVGERSNFILVPMAIAALEQVRDWGAAAIQSYCEHLLQDVLAEAAGLGFRIEDAEWRGAHLVGLRAPAGIDLAALDAELRRHHVFASLRGSALRVSPNVYNDDGDAGALLAALRAAAAAAAPRAAGIR
ncbi:MAG: aminotransferase class V-fold PLP-dependent enzyme [Longimicrobiales bacterium]